MAKPPTPPSPTVDVLLVNHSGPLFHLHDIEMALVSAGLSSHAIHGKTLPAVLPPARLVLQLGIGAIPDAGLQLLAHLREIAPTLPLLVCSSHAVESMDGMVRTCANATFIHRPLIVDQRFVGELVPLIKKLIATDT